MSLNPRPPLRQRRFSVATPAGSDAIGTVSLRKISL
jgi:hypothetical protein